jgi:Txe/YoeB family toxin of Txe-Axe toxin-antitoxin module
LGKATGVVDCVCPPPQLQLAQETKTNAHKIHSRRNRLRKKHRARWCRTLSARISLVYSNLANSNLAYSSLTYSSFTAILPV